MATRVLPLIALLVGAGALLLASGERSSAPWSVPSARADHCAVSPNVSASQPSNGLITAAFNAVGFNGLFPGHQFFGMPALENGSAQGRSLRSPYIPPTLLKAVGWIEASWRQADGGSAPVISFDCGYGIMQITAPGVRLQGIAWSMFSRAPEPIYSQVQVPLTQDYRANIAMGAKTLAAKWNLAPEFRPLVGNSNPAFLEDWYYALWSYNGFAFSNHPGNLSPLRGEYSCNLSDGFNHNRTQFPYQELVLGCVKHPPLVNGVELWPPIPVTLPASVPPFDPQNPQSMNIPSPTPTHGDPTLGTLPPPVVIDAPAVTAPQPFTVTGWAVDYTAPSSTGIDTIHVYAYPSDSAGTPTGEPVFLGIPKLGGWRPDVATAFGNPSFASAGYSLTACGLQPGFHNLVAFALSSVTGTWSGSQRVIQVPNSAAMALDKPRPGTAQQPFSVAGWAIDCGATGGSGVDAVHVYVYPSDSSGVPTGPPVVAQAASYGRSRADVGAAFGSQFTNSGYKLKVSGLPAGFYHLVVFAHSKATGDWNQVHRIIRVPTPLMALDTPPEGSTAQQPFLLTGWAIDRSAARGTGVDTVHVYAYPSDPSGVPTGPPVVAQAASYNRSRPDVGAAFGSQFTNSGYKLTISGLPPGHYHLVVFARSKITGAWNQAHRVIQVP